MKRKILLIDDEANKGWEAILKHLLFKDDIVESVKDIDQAEELILRNSYDLIFLDLRFGEKDHNSSDITEFGGYQVLQKLRADFLSVNFATPIILFTASNKVWHINKMLDFGCDDYYIKEHPDTSIDEEFTRENTQRLKKTVLQLLNENKNRKAVHNLIVSINEKVEDSIKNKNIRFRIKDKLKIGYGTLFKNKTALEQNQLVFNNEQMSFIVFWSILEELSKDFFKDNWIKSGSFEGMMVGNTWEFPQTHKPFIKKDLNDESLLVGIKYDKQNRQYIDSSITIEKTDTKEYSFYSGRINLSLQINAVMLLYKGWDSNTASRLFNPLNDYRNRIDFIHSSTSTIFNELLTNSDRDEAFDKNIEILSFINTLLD